MTDDVTAVALLVTVTVTPGTNARVLSSMVPLTVAYVDWAKAFPAKAKTSSNKLMTEVVLIVIPSHRTESAIPQDARPAFVPLLPVIRMALKPIDFRHRVESSFRRLENTGPQYDNHLDLDKLRTWQEWFTT